MRDLLGKGQEGMQGTEVTILQLACKWYEYKGYAGDVITMGRREAMGQVTFTMLASHHW